MSKAKLAAKITSEEQFAELKLQKLGPFNHSLYVGGQYYGQKRPWWNQREVLRINAGVYKQTSVTEAINNLFPWIAAHVSTEDPNQVAYTASDEDGGRDKQLRASPGRILKRFLPQLTDKEIQELEQRHRVELDDSFKIARTPEEIRRVYTTMRGDTGCMRGDIERWSNNHTHHPSVVYSGPGLGVAYLEDTNKTPIARCVVYQNPDDPSDKRCVRVYGAAILRTKLLNNGYQFKSLTGVKLARVSLKGAAPRFHFPYIDGVEGDQASGQASCVYDNGEYLVLIDHNQAKQFPNAKYARNSGGYIELLPPPKNEEFVSLISGKKFMSVTDVRTAIYYHGQFGYAPSSEVRGFISVSAWRDNGFTIVTAPREETFSGYALHEDTRNAANIRALDAEYYGANQWTQISYAVTSDARVIKAEDAVVYLPETGDLVVYHKDHAPARDRNWAKAVSGNIKTVYIHKRRATFKVGGTRSYFDSAYHAGQFIFDQVTNTWQRASKFTSSIVVGTRIYYLKARGGILATLALLTSAQIEELGQKIRQNAPNYQAEDVIASAMNRFFGRVIIGHNANGPILSYGSSFREIQSGMRTVPADAPEFAEQSRVFHALCRGANVQAI